MALTKNRDAPSRPKQECLLPVEKFEQIRYKTPDQTACLIDQLLPSFYRMGVAFDLIHALSIAVS